LAERLSSRKQGTVEKWAGVEGAGQLVASLTAANNAALL